MNEIQKRANPAPVSKLYLVPGDPLYEKLLIENPQKLKRMMKSEQLFFQKTHAVGWQETCEKEVADAYAHTDQWKKRSSDSRLLGLDTITGPITKRVVKNAYRRAARKLHPDAGGSDETFKQLHAAYRRLLAATKE